MERAHKAPLREGVRRQGLHKERTLRVALRPDTPCPRTEVQHEEQADAAQEVRLRMRQRAAQEQGEHRAFKAPLAAQLHHEHLLGIDGLLLL